MMMGQKGSPGLWKHPHLILKRLRNQHGIYWMAVSEIPRFGMNGFFICVSFCLCVSLFVNSKDLTDVSDSNFAHLGLRFVQQILS